MASSSGTGHDAATCPACGTAGAAFVTHVCVADRVMDADRVTVAAPDPAQIVLSALVGREPTENEWENVPALAALRALLAERQQDKERIEEQAEFVRAYDSLDDALDNLLDYLKLVRWAEPEDRNIKAALMWADRVAGYFGRCNVARADLAVEEDAE